MLTNFCHELPDLLILCRVFDGRCLENEKLVQAAVESRVTTCVLQVDPPVKIPEELLHPPRVKTDLGFLQFRVSTHEAPQLFHLRAKPKQKQLFVMFALLT